MWSVKQLGERAGVTGGYIRRLLIEGEEIQGKKLGYTWYIPDEEAARWLKERGVDDVEPPLEEK